VAGRFLTKTINFATHAACQH